MSASANTVLAWRVSDTIMRDKGERLTFLSTLAGVTCGSGPHAPLRGSLPPKGAYFPRGGPSENRLRPLSTSGRPTCGTRWRTGHHALPGACIAIPIAMKEIAPRAAPLLSACARCGQPRALRSPRQAARAGQRACELGQKACGTVRLFQNRVDVPSPPFEAFLPNARLA